MLVVEGLVCIVVRDFITFVGHVDIILVRFACFGVYFLIVISLLVGLDIPNDINIGSIDILEHPHLRINSNTGGSINTNDLNAVTWLHIVHQILICTHVDRLWSFTLRHCFWCLLHLDVLLVREHAKVMNHLKSHSASALVAILGLCDLSSLDILVLFLHTFCAPVAGLFHFWDGVGSSDHNTFQRDEFIDVLWVEFSDLVSFHQVVGAHLDDLIILLLLHLHIRVLAHIHSKSTCTCLDVLLEDLDGDQIENGNDICGVVFQLLVQLWIKCSNVIAVNVQSVIFSLSDLLQERDVYWLLIGKRFPLVFIHIILIRSLYQECG